MSKFCTNCGTALDENTKFCTNCGAANEPVSPAPEAPVQPEPEVPAQPEPAAEVSAQPAQEAPVQPEPEVPVQPAPVAAPAAAKKPVDLKKLLVPAVAVVAVIAVVILLFSLFGGKGSGYESAIDTYFDYMLGKASKSEIKSLLPDGYWEYREAEYGKTFDDYYAEIQQSYEQLPERWENEYGKKVKVTYEITKEWNVSDRNQELIAAALLRQYGIEEDALTNARRLEMDATVSGSEDEEEDDMDFYVLKIDGDWYLASVSLDGETTNVYFFAS